jgi:hypothetical protein
LAATTVAKTTATIARRILDDGQLIGGVAMKSQDRELWMRNPATFEQFAIAPRGSSHLLPLDSQAKYAAQYVLMKFYIGVQVARPLRARPGKEARLEMVIRDRDRSPDWRTGTEADETWGNAGFVGLDLLLIRKVSS